MAYLQRIGTAVPEHDIHEKFVRFAEHMLTDARSQAMFRRLASRSGIQHRYSCLGEDVHSAEGVDAFSFFGAGKVPTTERRMSVFEKSAPMLLRKALDDLCLQDAERSNIRHVLVTCCTGLYAPGLDFAVLDHLHLPPSTERTVIGFMGCYAAINALRTARHIVRANPDDSVLIVSLELCSLHFHPSQNLNDVLSFLLFADGCAAALVSATPSGLALDQFETLQIENSRDSITWRVGDLGFDMYLSSHVPHQIAEAMRRHVEGPSRVAEVDLWAVHPGGRAILDAVESGLGLHADSLQTSRKVLQEFGNMSSATVLFVLKELMKTAAKGKQGCAMSFGPGLTAETMGFHAV